MKFFQKKSEFFDLITAIYTELENITAVLSESAKDFRDFETYAARAKAIEHAGDARTHEVIKTLNQLFVTPFDREDIYLLVQELDDVIDLIENVIKKVYLYGIKKESPAFREFAELIAAATAELGKLLECLREMKHSSKFTHTKIKVHELEDQGDVIFDHAIRKLLKEETDVIQVIKNKDILEDQEAIMDKYQKISNIIEGILVKSN